MFSGSSTPAQPQPRQVNSVRASLCSRGEPPLSLYIVQPQDRSSAALTASPPESPAPASVPSQLSFASFLSPPNQATQPPADGPPHWQTLSRSQVFPPHPHLAPNAGSINLNYVCSQADSDRNNELLASTSKRLPVISCANYVRPHRRRPGPPTGIRNGLPAGRRRRHGVPGPAAWLSAWQSPRLLAPSNSYNALNWPGLS